MWISLLAKVRCFVSFPYIIGKEDKAVIYWVIGRGLILLLFGPPGVGKSLTAEAGKPKFLSCFLGF